MLIILNGRKIETEAQTLLDLLKEHNFPLDKIAVERNAQIEMPQNFQDCLLNPSDVLEVVTFVGGG